MDALTAGFLGAIAALAICLFASACAPRQPPGGDLWRIVSHSEVTR
jgi:hypothetical protein